MDTIDSEALVLAEKERWAQVIANKITRGECRIVAGRIDPSLALEGARLASLWLDDYKLLCEKYPLPPKEAFNTSYSTALNRATGISRYASGAPLLTVIISAWSAFSSAFEDDADTVWEILTDRS